MKTTWLPHFFLHLLAARWLAASAVAALTLSGVWAAPWPAQPGHTQRLDSPDTVPDGLSAPDWSSIRQQYEQHRHAAVPVDGGLQARNPGQQWQTRFDGRGFITKPDAAGWQWGLELKSYGFAGRERAVTGQSRVNTSGQRVTYDWDGTLQEWFVNDSRGLEHGFTVRERPAAEPKPSTFNLQQPTSNEPAAAPSLTSPPSTLNFLLAVRGGLRPEVQADGRGVRFVDDCGVTVITYAGLIVFDTDGRKLAAHFEPVERSRRSNEADSGVDSDAQKFEPIRLVTSAATDELRLVIDERGARYPLTIDPIAQQAYLKASNAEANDSFGSSVAVSGDTLVIGAPGESSNATGVNGNQSDNSALSSGAAYVFVRSGGVWIQQVYLKASNTGGGDSFGVSVALSGDTAVIGAYFEASNATGVNGNQSNNSATNSGAAYVFVRNGTNWTQQAYLKASNAGGWPPGQDYGGDSFGSSVSVSGDTVVVGASGESSSATGVNGNQSDNTASGSGAAYVFVRNGTSWTQQAYLKASNTESSDAFSTSVSVSSDTVAVGAPYESSSATGINGDQNDNSAAYSGAAYVFVRNGTTWSQQAYVKASNTGENDVFGTSVAVSGDTVLVGANGESSNATGANGDESDNSAPNSGAAYVFVRNGTSWIQQAYLKASNSGTNDYYGQSVAVSGDTVVIGASGESSNAAGVNGSQSDNSATEAGAAYVFTRSGNDWIQQAYLKASNTESNDFFGRSAAVSGGTVVVGAYSEASNATGVNGNQGNNSARYSGAAYVFDLNSAPAPEIAVEYPTGVDLGNGAKANFGHGPVGGSTQRTFNIKNTGSADLAGLGITITGASAAEFTVTAHPTAPLAPGSNTTFTVTFVRGAGLAGKSAVLHLASNDNDESTFDITLTAPGLDAQQAYLKASNTGEADWFGYAVAVSGDILAVGAPFESSNATGVNGDQSDNSAGGSGAAYVFARDGTNWIQQAYLKASNNEAFDSFGSSVAVSGDTVVVTAVGESSNATGVNGNQSNNNAFGSGAAYVFVRNGTNWIQQAYLKASNTGPTNQFGENDKFGWSVSVSGDTIVIGAISEDSNATGVNGNQSNNSALNSGAAYVFVRSGTNWTQQAYLKASNTGGSPTEGFLGDAFGGSVAVSGDTVLVGAFQESSTATGVNGNQSNNNAEYSGAAYVFVRSGTNWTQQAYLKPSNTGTNDHFGRSVSVSGDTVVVGAWQELSDATGVNGDQSINTGGARGAAYVFVRTGTNWTQQAYLKASNTALNFGITVAVSGDTVLVGAPYEHSSATGVNGDESDNSAEGAGAAYLFVRNGTNWIQQAYLKASNTESGDQFGISVAVSGDTVVVVAWFEASNATGVNGDQGDNSAGGSGAAYVFTGLGVGPSLAVAPDASSAYFIRFTGAPDVRYRLQRAPTVTGPWETIATNTAPASGLIEYHETNPLPDAAFYRTVMP